jgi:azurin
MALLKLASADESMRVRLEAVRVASFFKGEDANAALEVAYAVLKKPTDYYIDYCFKETLKQLQSLQKEFVLPTDPEVLSSLLEKLSDGDLNKAPNVEAVLNARLSRKSIDAGTREKALKELALLHNSSREIELAATLEKLDAKGGVASGAVDELGKLIAVTPAPKLASVRSLLAGLTEKATQNGVRRAAWGALILADADPQTTWKSAQNDAAKAALIDAIGFISDPTLRAKFQPLLTESLANPKLASSIRAAVVRALPLTGAEYAKTNFATLLAFLEKGDERTGAARSLLQLPRDSWSAEGVASAVKSVIAWANTVPTDKRTQQSFVETVQTATQLASLLSAEEALAVRKELRGLGVSVFVVKTVREQMRYDTARLVVAAGKPFELIVENTDVMPHNLLIVTPGARQAVAESVQTRRPDQLDKKGRPYVPEKDNRVLEATRLLEPGQKETLKMTAPDKEGEYEYVCSFPGHSMIMWGKLVVTKDVDGYLQSHPESAQPSAKSGGNLEHKHASLK